MKIEISKLVAETLGGNSVASRASATKSAISLKNLRITLKKCTCLHQKTDTHLQHQKRFFQLIKNNNYEKDNYNDCLFFVDSGFCK